MQVSTWLSNITFQVAIDSELCQSLPLSDIVSKLCTPPCEVDVLSWYPFLGQLSHTVTARRFRSALCSEVLIRNILIWSYPQCLLRDQWIIERLSKAMSATLIISCQFHRKFHFIWKKSDSSVSSRSKDQQPLELRLKLKLCSLTNGLSMSKSQNKLSGVSMF